MEQMLPTVLAIAAASLLYVAVADLIPSLHRRPEPLETVRQFALIALGVGVIAIAHALLAALSRSARRCRATRASRYHPLSALHSPALR